MRTYEFAMENCKSPILTVCIVEDERNGGNVTTTWRDFDGHLAKARLKVQTSTETQKFKEFVEQIISFWKMVCNTERRYGPHMVDAIIASVSDPDLRELLVQNS